MDKKIDDKTIFFNIFYYFRINFILIKFNLRFIEKVTRLYDVENWKVVINDDVS